MRSVRKRGRRQNVGKEPAYPRHVLSGDQGWATGLKSRGICVPGQQSRDAGLGPGLIFLNLRGTGTHFRGTVPRGNGTGTENPASAGQQNPAGLGTVPHIFAVPRHSIIPQKIQRAFDLHLFLASKIEVTCFLMPMNF